MHVVRKEARLISRGLPERLPQGERVLWQGSPKAGLLLRRAFHARFVALYFAVIIAASAATAVSHGAGSHQVAISILHRLALAIVPLALMAAYAWAVARTTTYSITNRRVVVSCGIALPISFNLPFARIEAAGLRLYPGGAGDITLRLQAGETLLYFAIWPHARPWRMARTEPMLRCLPNAERASAVLADALQDYAGAQSVAEMAVAEGPVGEVSRATTTAVADLRAGAMAA